MPREKECFRDQLQRLDEKYPGQEVLDLKDACDLLRTDRKTLLCDQSFPAKKVGGKYIIPLVALARWLA